MEEKESLWRLFCRSGLTMGRRKVDADWKLASSGWGGGKGGKYRRATMSQESCGRANTWTTSPPLSLSLSGPDHTKAQRQRESPETAEDAEGGDRLSPVHPAKETLEPHWRKGGTGGRIVGDRWELWAVGGGKLAAEGENQGFTCRFNHLIGS